MFNSWEDVGPQKGKQEMAMSLVGDVDFMLWGGSRYGGKMLPLDELVLTDKGFVKNGDLSVGDCVVNPTTGKPIKILAISPVKTVTPYVITFEDGATIECCGEHLWTVRRTNTSIKRDGKRASGEDSYQTISTFDLKVWADRAIKAKEEGRQQGWPVIPLTVPAEFDAGVTPTVDPYLLGLLLGDGCISDSKYLSLTTNDEEILDYASGLVECSIHSKTGTTAKNLSFKGESKKELVSALKTLGLIGTKSLTKFIPNECFNYSLTDRYRLVQGLMDTDGTVHGHGKVQFNSISPELIDGMKRLVESLGCITQTTSKIPFYYDKNRTKKFCSRSYTLNINSTQPAKLFCLERKAGKASDWPTQRNYRKVVSVEPDLSRKVDMQCISVASEEGLYIASENYIVTHNSQILSMVPLSFTDDPKYRGIFFRNTYGEITGAGSLWDKAEGMYPLFDAESRQNPLCWKFPSGATQYYSYMDQESDKESHRGKGYSLIGFDEIDKFTPTQITFMFTCLRSEADCNATMIGTLNPDPDSWLLPLVEFYLDDEGFPDPEKCGIIRYFIIDDNNDFIFGDSEEFFKENYRDYLYVYDPNEDEEIYVPPKTFTYIFFNIYDNPLGMRAEPKYLMQLNNLPDHEKKTQLLGNWYARPKASSMWSRDWIRGENGERVLQRADIPDNCVTVRGVDKAHTEPHAGNRYPDYTALSPKILKDENGFYYLLGDYIEEFIDPIRRKSDKPVIGRFRKGPGARDALLVKQLQHDNASIKCTLILPKDSGGGKSDGLYTKAKLTENKIPTEDGNTPTNVPDKKIKDFSPFANACQQGLVYIVEDSFHPSTLRVIYQELENFNGQKSSSVRKDDFVDAIALAFNYAITARRPYKTPNIGASQDNSKTLGYHLINSNNAIKDFYVKK